MFEKESLKGKGEPRKGDSVIARYIMPKTDEGEETVMVVGLIGEEGWIKAYPLDWDFWEVHFDNGISRKVDKKDLYKSVWRIDKVYRSKNPVP